MKTPAWIACAAAALLCLPTMLGAEEAPAAKESAPATVTVKRGPLGGVIKAKGVLVPASYERVTIEFEAYRGKLEILEVAPEGRVVKGQTLVRFDDTDYKKMLVAQERGLELKRLGLERAQRLHELGKASIAIKRDESLRAKRLADEALDRFVEVERKLKEQDAAHRIAGQRISIQNMREELAQLESMYTEDDLTEETEEIVLKRNRRNMERMLSSFERYKTRHEYGTKLGLEREFESLRIAVRKATSSLDKLQATLPLDKKKAELELAAAQEGFAKAEEGLAELRGDAEAFTLKAPMAGTAVRGTFAGGAWKGLGNPEAYGAGEAMKVGQSPYTILDESVMRVHTSVKEADLASVKAGASASIKTSLTAKDALECEVATVARYGAGGSYKVILRVKAEDKRLRAGLGCSVEITRDAPEAVLSIPKSCILSEGGKQYVFPVGGEKTEIKTGESAGARVEVVEGLSAGEKLLATPPKAEADDDKKKADKKDDDAK
ncbi:MAG: hypothetical protein P1V36_08130 [Planctomycetota bacterium]|nr:hypothetical protein [Planctomycetota bacterium]